MEETRQQRGRIQRYADGSMNRWVDDSSARCLSLMILNNRVKGTTTCAPSVTLPEEILTHCIPQFLHFDAPISGMIYVFGGRASKVLEPEHYLNTAECYDTFRNEWIQLPSMSSKRVGASSIVAENGIVYIIGGYAKHPDKPLATGECFDPRKGEWRPIAELSQGRFGHSIASCGKCLYVIGGDSRRNLVSGIERYDTESDSWMTVGLLPRPVAGGRTLERHGKLYLIGGDIGSHPLSFTNTVRVYDPESNAWSVLEQSLEQGRSATACAWLSEGSSEIAVIGGYAAENDTFFELKSSEIIQTDPNGDSVAKGRTIPHLPQARAGCRAVTIGHKIYVVGGETPESNLAELMNPQMETDLTNSRAAILPPHRPLSNVRELLIQALQHRLNPMRQSGSPIIDDDHALRLPVATRLPSNSAPTERKAHPVVAVFNTLSWEWEKDTPIMSTPRTAASVCVGTGYPASFGWCTEARWLTEKPCAPLTCYEDISNRRPQAASG